MLSVRRPGRLPVAGLVVLLCLAVAACSGSREPTPPPDEAPPTADRPPPPPAEREEPAPTPRTVQGFRIQILTTSDKPAADDEVAEALSWWSTLPASQRPGDLGANELAVDVKWLQPYYRVRLGNFATRNDAQQVLSFVKQRFPDAFIVPDAVTIWR